MQITVISDGVGHSNLAGQFRTMQYRAVQYCNDTDDWRQ